MEQKLNEIRASNATVLQEREAQARALEEQQMVQNLETSRGRTSCSNALNLFPLHAFFPAHKQELAATLAAEKEAAAQARALEREQFAAETARRVEGIPFF